MKERVSKSLPLALGLFVGSLASLLISEYGPRAFESSAPDRLTGLGYQITPDRNQGDIIEVRTTRFPGWAGRFLAPLALELAKDRMSRVCAEDVWDRFIPIRQVDINGGTIEIYKPFQADNRTSCFPSTL